MKSPPRPSLQASHLDAMRGVAALFVVFQHSRQLFFAPDSHLATSRTVGGFLLHLTGLGGAAVNTFFVLSGFLIASSIRNSVEKGRWSWTGYTEARLTRLLVPLIPALCLTAFWDQLGLYTSSTNTIYYEYFNDPILGNLSSSIVDFVGNIFFLQNVFVRNFGSNGPLWSLAPEFWYYTIFPLLFFAVAKIQPVARRVGFGIVAALLFVILTIFDRDLIFRFPQWLCGVAVAFLPSREWPTKAWFRVPVLVALFAALVHGWLWNGVNFRVIDQWLAVCIALVIWSFLCKSTRSPSEPYRRVASFFSEISYTLYLAHFPFLVFCSALVFGTHERWSESPLHYMLLFVVVAVAVVYSSIPWFIFERNTPKIRAWVRRVWPPRPSLAQSTLPEAEGKLG